ncbi:Glycosyltransferase, GT2 family [Microbulbifer donghaiensis]|uniref:Glycosyltransferase, GT2 family n=1 Tax=Microbulbifer donghaiensis TaxID=494016 RepID=A0A1M4TYV7_9GAMM|nr:glycosyltransferase [Microbulbifer donghaiensis]SHE49527.1 Glycosyltransferase, GT2 family [Microbulbifer donghaiensis]
MENPYLKFSVIVPVFNQWRLVSKLLTCLSRQTLAREVYEIILVDNGSDLERAPECFGLNVRILHCQKPGSYAARNMGVRAAHAEWLVFTDADCLPNPDWLERIADRIKSVSQSNLVLAGRVTVTQASKNPCAYEIYDFVKGIRQDRYVSRGYAATANLCVAKSFAEQIGLFNAEVFSGGDVDFCRRALKSGANLVYLASANVNHPPRTSWRELAIKARRIKGGQYAKARGLARFMIVFRTLLPPVNAFKDFLYSGQYSFKFRVLAAMVQVRLWFLEVCELFRLAVNGQAERR